MSPSFSASSVSIARPQFPSSLSLPLAYSKLPPPRQRVGELCVQCGGFWEKNDLKEANRLGWFWDIEPICRAHYLPSQPSGDPEESKNQEIFI